MEPTKRSGPIKLDAIDDYLRVDNIGIEKQNYYHTPLTVSSSTCTDNVCRPMYVDLSMMQEKAPISNLVRRKDNFGSFPKKTCQYLFIKLQFRIDEN